MPGFSELVERTTLRLENEDLLTFMKSFSNESGDLAQAGEVSERDRPFVEAFQKVYEAISRVEEKTRQLAAAGGDADDLVVEDQARSRVAGPQVNGELIEGREHRGDGAAGGLLSL